MTYADRELSDRDLIEIGRGLAALVEPRVLAVVVPLAKQLLELTARIEALETALLIKEHNDGV